MSEKWTVIENGNEVVWTMDKVEKQIKFGIILFIISFFPGIIVIGIWFYVQSTVPYTSFFSHIAEGIMNPIMWIGAFLLVIGFHGAVMTNKANNAKQVCEIKKKEGIL